MRLKTAVLVLSLSVLVTNSALAPRSSDVLQEQLYNNVIVGDYANAIAQTRDLEGEQKGDVIKDVVTRLVKDSKRNVIEYAYQLWNQTMQETVRQYFPIQFRLIVGGNYIKFINKKDGLAVKLDATPDSQGDRVAWGDASDKTSQRVNWKMIPVWDDNRVYFKFFSTHYKQYLKLEISSDSAGDHKAFGANEDDTNRHQWYLFPVEYEHDLLFYIFNREYNQALKQAAAVDSYGDRMIWGHSGNVFKNPEYYGWFIVPF